VLAQSKASDVVDPHPVICAVRIGGDDILTDDQDDFATLTAKFGPAAPPSTPGHETGAA